MFWIRACMQWVWTGSIEIKLSTDIISWYFGTYNVRQRLRRDCASLHSQVKHWWLWYVKHHRFYVEWINFVSHDSNHNLEKALLYISFYKQTNLANLLSCLTLWFAWLFFKVVTSTVTFRCSILMTRQRSPKSFMVNISLDGRFLAVNVTPNPCPRHVCWMSVTMLMTIAE